MVEEVKWYTQPLHEISEEKKEKLIEIYSKEIVDKYFNWRAKRLEIIRDADKHPPQVVKDCFMLSRWMNPDYVKEDLQEVKEILEKIGGPFWMQYAVLLCNHRDGEFFFADHDVDIGMPINIPKGEEKNWKKIITERFKPFEDAGYELEIPCRKRFFGLRIMAKKKVMFDIFLYDEWKDHYVFSDFKQFNDYEAWPVDLFNNTKDMNFCGTNFPVPSDVEKSLAMDYGEQWKQKDSGKKPLNVAIIPLDEVKKMYDEKISWRLEDSEEIVTLKDMCNCYKINIEDLKNG